MLFIRKVIIPVSKLSFLFPGRKQKMLFSATKPSKTNELVKVVLKEDFIDIDVTTGEDLITADGLNQCEL